jgi:hypothetical protein
LTTWLAASAAGAGERHGEEKEEKGSGQNWQDPKAASEAQKQKTQE